MKKIVAILFLFLVLQSKAKAEMLLIGYGATSCGDYTVEIQKDTSMKQVFVSWAHGYMSAINARNTTTNDELDLSSVLPLSGQIDFLSKYCDKHPDKLFVFGVIKLMSILAQT